MINRCIPNPQSTIHYWQTTVVLSIQVQFQFLHRNAQLTYLDSLCMKTSCVFLFALCKKMASSTDHQSHNHSSLNSCFLQGLKRLFWRKKALYMFVLWGLSGNRIRGQQEQRRGEKKQKKTAPWHLHEEEERRWECKLNLSQKVSTRTQLGSFTKCAQWLSCFVTGDSSPAARTQILTELRHNERILLLNWTLHHRLHHCRGVGWWWGGRWVYMQKTLQTSVKVCSNNTGTRLTLEPQTATHDGDHPSPYGAPALLGGGSLWRWPGTTTHPPPPAVPPHKTRGFPIKLGREISRRITLANG